MTIAVKLSAFLSGTVTATSDSDGTGPLTATRVDLSSGRATSFAEGGDDVVFCSNVYAREGENVVGANQSVTITLGSLTDVLGEAVVPVRTVGLLVRNRSEAAIPFTCDCAVLPATGEFTPGETFCRFAGTESLDGWEIDPEDELVLTFPNGSTYQYDITLLLGTQ